jgi:c-di-GMP-binding flagellar brake protein YcgR
LLRSDGGARLLALRNCRAMVGEGVSEVERPLRIYRTVVNPNSKSHQRRQHYRMSLSAVVVVFLDAQSEPRTRVNQADARVCR